MITTNPAQRFRRRIRPESDVDPIDKLQELISNGKLIEAGEHLNGCLAKDPQNQDFLNALGSLQFNSKQFPEAVATFETICDFDNENVDSHLKAAGAAFFAEVYDTFEKHLHFVLEREPENAHAHQTTGFSKF